VRRRRPGLRARSLMLAAMSLGYGVVQLDVTIVNTALNASLVIAAGVLLTAAVAILLDAYANLSGTSKAAS
jgi:hypothetical protein